MSFITFEKGELRETLVKGYTQNIMPLSGEQDGIFYVGLLTTKDGTAQLVDADYNPFAAYRTMLTLSELPVIADTGIIDDLLINYSSMDETSEDTISEFISKEAYQRILAQQPSLDKIKLWFRERHLDINPHAIVRELVLHNDPSLEQLLAECESEQLVTRGLRDDYNQARATLTPILELADFKQPTYLGDIGFAQIYNDAAATVIPYVLDCMEEHLSKSRETDLHLYESAKGKNPEELRQQFNHFIDAQEKILSLFKGTKHYSSANKREVELFLTSEFALREIVRLEREKVDLRSRLVLYPGQDSTVKTINNFSTDLVAHINAYVKRTMPDQYGFD